VVAKAKEPLNKSMTTLAFRESRYQGALLPTCVGLSRKCNAESEILCRPLRAGTGAHCCSVVVLANGMTITCARRLVSARARLPQSSHRLVQRLPNSAKPKAARISSGHCRGAGSVAEAGWAQDRACAFFPAAHFGFLEY
jgi:hypothetical protein